MYTLHIYILGIINQQTELVGTTLWGIWMWDKAWLAAPSLSLHQGR